MEFAPSQITADLQSVELTLAQPTHKRGITPFSVGNQIPIWLVPHLDNIIIILLNQGFTDISPSFENIFLVMSALILSMCLMLLSNSSDTLYKLMPFILLR